MVSFVKWHPKHRSSKWPIQHHTNLTHNEVTYFEKVGFSFSCQQKDNACNLFRGQCFTPTSWLVIASNKPLFQHYINVRPTNANVLPTICNNKSVRVRPQ